MMDISEWASTSLQAIPADPDDDSVSFSESNLPRLPQPLVCSGLVIERGFHDYDTWRIDYLQWSAPRDTYGGLGSAASRRPVPKAAFGSRVVTTGWTPHQVTGPANKALQGVAVGERVAPALPSLWRSQLNADTLGGQALRMRHHFATIEKDGWTLESGEERHALSPKTFEIPSRARRESLCPGDAAKLLFDIETRDAGRVVDRGVERMWVIVKTKAKGLYIGILDSDPGIAKGLTLRPGTEVLFGVEHVISIDRPPADYLLGKFGPGFFDG